MSTFGRDPGLIPRRLSPSSAYLLVIGLVSILGQVVILRELEVAFYGIELIYILALGIWLLGTALGASAGRRSLAPGEWFVRVLFLIMSIVVMADIVLIRGMRRLFGGVPGGFLPFDLQIGGLIAAVVPMSILCGLLFQAAAKRFVRQGGTLARAYGIESAGGVIGGLLSTVSLSLGVSNLDAGLFSSACSLATVPFLSWKTDSRLQTGISLAGLLTLLLMFPFSGRMDRWMTSWNHPDVIASSDTPYGRVTVTSQYEQICVFENDVLSYETETTGAEEFVQLSTLQSINPKSVLVLGGGFQGIVFELLKLPVESIDYVEMNGRTIELVADHLPRNLKDALRDKRVRIIYQDPREFKGSAYDAVLVAMPEPASAQNNRFYTREFYEECSGKLNRGGIIAFMIPSAENLWTSQLEKRNGSIYRALRSACAYTVVLPGAANIFIGSNSPLTQDTKTLSERLLDRHPETRLVSPQYINYIYTNDRFETVNRLLSTVRVEPNSDSRPACYAYTLSIWLSKLISDYPSDLDRISLFNLSVRSPIFWLAAAAVVIVIAVKRYTAARLFLLTATAGFTGMVLETILILNYQNESGALYQDIGILLMTFMAGLAAGALVFERRFKSRRSMPEKRTGAIILLGLTALSLIVYCGIRFELLGGLIGAMLILFLDGTLVSCAFAFATLIAADKSEHAPTWLYSADLVGGCLASVTVSLLLLPILGMLPTCVLSGAMSTLGLIYLK